jgi:type IV pilus assembly protein PilY1
VRAWLIGALLMSGVALANPPRTFAKGSLIIPMQANFQNGCGVAAAYGLVYSLLFENRPGGAFDGQPVTIYWAINGGKASHNRCTPTNRNTIPLTPNSGWNDPAWNDGCDFSIVNNNPGEAPVVPVPYTLPYPVSGVYPYGNVNFIATNHTQARPWFGATTLDHTVTSPKWSTIQYQGAPFIIDAVDAQRVITAMNTVPQLAKYRTTGACNTGNSVWGNHYVVMHQAAVQFTAPIYKRINKVPPKVAVLENGGGVSTGILLGYLKNAGLDTFPNAQGTFAMPGLIYDALNADTDLHVVPGFPRGKLNAIENGKPRYQVFWAPHWDLSKANVTAAQRIEAAENIAHFANQKGHGIFAECASLESFEGSWEGGKQQYVAVTNQSRFQYTAGIDTDGLSNSTGWPSRNCTDPDYLASAAPRPACTRYLAPAQPFSQIGDFSFNNTSGHVKQYRPYTTGGSARRATYTRMATSWVNWPSGVDNTGDNGWDFYSLSQKDDSPDKATIVYLAGHNYENDIAGHRIVLNTLLNLGADPVPEDRVMSAPTPFMNNAGQPRALTAMYTIITGDTLPGTVTFDWPTAKNWWFPFTAGDLRQRNVNALDVGSNEFSTAVEWSANERMPRPADRNLFTYFGGRTVASPPLSDGRRVKNNVAQLGWVPARIEHTQINANFTSGQTTPNPDCVDVQKYGNFVGPGGTNESGLIPGSDGICDLQQALQLTYFAWLYNPGNGQNEVPPGHISTMQTEATRARHFVQLLRGFCYVLDGAGNPVFEPTDAQCAAYGSNQRNRAVFGGAVHSTAAVVKPSSYIQDQGAPRPTVAYVGTWDGQLHAVYVEGGAGYQGPLQPRQYLNPSAASTFKVDWATRFATNTNLPLPGTELWSFMPATQLPLAAKNGAMVDSSPVIMDVFVDLYGTGIRRWHSVLVVSVGATGSEFFAFDVTNPLKPVLLWDIVGRNVQNGGFPYFAGVSASDYNITGEASPVEWDNVTADYVLPPLADPGRSYGYAFDYGALGGSRALSIGLMRDGLEPNYVVFSATNSRPTSGLSIFATDIGTGQKIWQWRQRYVAGRGADNTVPPPVAVANGLDGAATVYAGDMEGRVWELSAKNGASLTAWRSVNPPVCNSAASCNFAAYDTRGTVANPQPITSNIAYAKLPQAPSGALANYGSERVLMFATAGADWVPSGVGGAFHVALFEEHRRRPVRTDATAQSQALNGGGSPSLGGVLTKPASNDIPAFFPAPDRVYGFITVSGQTVFVPIVSGRGGNDPLSVSKSLGGRTLALDLGNIQTNTYDSTLPSFNLANFGGVAVFSIPPPTGSGPNQTIVVADEIGKTKKFMAAPGTTDRMAPNPTLNPNQSIPYRVFNVIRRYFSQVNEL